MATTNVRNIVVIDLELNQPSEKIIELGYVIGNPLSRDILCSRSIFIDPMEKLAPEIVELTKIEQNMVDGASNVDKACDQLAKDVTEHQVVPLIHQWGIGDTFLLREQLENLTGWKFGRRWIDVKALAQTHAILNGMRPYIGLRRMAARLGIEMSAEKAHRADYDAEITFFVHCHLAQALTA